MKKLLKSEICESVNSTRCAVIGKKNLKSQSLWLLFIEQCMNSSRNNQNAPKRVKKKNANAGLGRKRPIQTHSKATFLKNELKEKTKVVF